MDKRTITLVVTFFALIVVGMFAYAYLKQQELKDTVATELPATPQEPATAIPFGIDRINTTEYFIDGTHTFVGEVVMPTPCDLLEVEAMVLESFPEQIRLNFSVINNSDSCAQVMTPQRFSVTAQASKQATVSATLQGVSVPLNIIPAAAGERPEDFEVFIKG